MQATAQQLKDTLWEKLKAVFTKYMNANNEIDVKTIEEIIVDVLHEDQSEVDYVMKNMFRIDVDGSGFVDFTELGNFLFKRHCGQISLQKEHKAKRMSRGAERMMTFQEFLLLMNNAYKFLEVGCPEETAQFIFKETDKDGDGCITYIEYFKLIEIYVCKSKKEMEAPAPPPPPPQGPERHSRLRIHIWGMLRRLYDGYVQGRSLSVTDLELRHLVFAIVGELSENELAFLSTGLLQLNYKVISFEPFAEHFLFLIAELGLSRYSRNNPMGKKSLNRDEFILILENSFSFAKLTRFKRSILYKIFAKIDKNNDGLITFDQYLDWVKRFLAVLKYFGDEFYVPEDDEDLDSSDPFEKDQKTCAPPPPPVNNNKVNFVFSDYTFAKQVRARVLECLIPYDADKNCAFDEEEIKNALLGLLKESEHEILYVTKNVFRYDRDNDGEVTYEELTNFCVEQHFGEMAIQRLHKKKFYSKGSERMMNKEEFGKTMNIALEYINMQASQEIIDLLFSEIDLDHDGWITYVVYFLFLRYYFGSCSPVAKEPIKMINTAKPLSDLEQFMLAYKDMNPWDRFVRIIIDQLRVIFFRYDTNKNQVFEIDEIREILEKVLGFDENEISYVIYNYFSFLKTQSDNVSFDQLIAIILSIYFIEILFSRRYKSKDSEAWKSKKINLEEFIALITEGCFFIKYKPARDDLVFIFGELDTDKDGFITFQQFVDFIRKYLGNNIDPWAKKEVKEEKVAASLPPSIQGVSEEEYGFVNAVWDELKVYFDKYDQGAKGYLNEAELKIFVVEVLKETTERELNYVFWNLFRVDSDANKEVEFLEFAPFILNHAGEIALQRFHREQIKGKTALSEEELYIVISNAFRFLSSMPKQRGVINMIYARISKEGVLSYGAYMNWVHKAMAGKYAKK